MIDEVLNVTEDESSIRIGGLAPLSRPGWVHAGRHLVAGLELAVSEVNAHGGVLGKPLELVVSDTAADPNRAATAITEFAEWGASAVVGEYHSVAARAAAARADEIGLPYLCSSAVIDQLTAEPTDWIARIAPPQSDGWRCYAEFLYGAGHLRIALATESSVYWASGVQILRNYFTPRGGTMHEFDMRGLTPTTLCDRIVEHGPTAILLLVGNPEPAISIVKALRSDQRLAGILIGAPAGQPEFDEWIDLTSGEGGAIPFLQYLPQQLGPLGVRVEAALRLRINATPSFVAFEGYDSVMVLAQIMRSHGVGRANIANSWSRVSLEGTRGHMQFSKTVGINVWQWNRAPVQVVQRDPVLSDRFRVLYSGSTYSNEAPFK